MTTRPEPWLDEREQAAWRAYVAGYSGLMAELNRRLLAVSGLSIVDYEVLVHLSEAPEGRVRSFVLAEALRWERSRLTHQLARMEQRGLVVRTPCLEDRRGSHVELTPAGRRALRRAAPHHAADVRELFVDPGGRDLDAVRRVSSRIQEAVVADGE